MTDRDPKDQAAEATRQSEALAQTLLRTVRDANVTIAVALCATGIFEAYVRALSVEHGVNESTVDAAFDAGRFDGAAASRVILRGIHQKTQN